MVAGFAFKRRGYGLRVQAAGLRTSLQAAGLRASRKKIRRRSADFFVFAKAKVSIFGIGADHRWMDKSKHKKLDIYPTWRLLIFVVNHEGNELSNLMLYLAREEILS